MMHKPVQFNNLCLTFPHKTCFQDFSGQIRYGDRICIIGCNGSGKSSLLKMLAGYLVPGDGEIKCSSDVTAGYLPQVIDDFPELSGGQRLNQMLTGILAANPDILLLDEPTNHLDSQNRGSLLRMLKYYQGSLVIVSHDLQLITETTDIIWHINSPNVTVFAGNYKDYQREFALKKATIEQELSLLSRQKKEAHQTLMKEQQRNKSARIRGEKHINQRKWPTIRSHSKMAKAVKTGDKRLSQINDRKQHLLQQIESIHLPEQIQAKFKLKAHEYHKTLITVRDGSVCYENGNIILRDINFQMLGSERIALSGENGSGKSTFIRALLNQSLVTKTGEWLLPQAKDIGYLDQHYQNLIDDNTVLEWMSDLMPESSYIEVRKHLNDFLFRKNEEIQTCIANLSGGEKARLSLAGIAANPPKLLILDELTNNLDLETRAHAIEVLNKFPGAILVISHDEDFLRSIQIESIYQIGLA